MGPEKVVHNISGSLYSTIHTALFRIIYKMRGTLMKIWCCTVRKPTIWCVLPLPVKTQIKSLPSGKALFSNLLIPNMWTIHFIIYLRLFEHNVSSKISNTFLFLSSIKMLRFRAVFSQNACQKGKKGRP